MHVQDRVTTGGVSETFSHRTIRAAAGLVAGMGRQDLRKCRHGRAGGAYRKLGWDDLLFMLAKRRLRARGADEVEGPSIFGFAPHPVMH